MDKQKLTHQLFIGKVAEIIGQEKTTELLREAKTAIDAIEPHLPLGDVSGRSEQLPCDNCANWKQGSDPRNYCMECNRMVEL